MVLGGLNLLDGKKATCYPGFEAELIGADTTGESVVQSDNIITGRGPAFVFDFGLALIEAISGIDAKNEVQAGLLL